MTFVCEGDHKTVFSGTKAITASGGSGSYTYSTTLGQVGGNYKVVDGVTMNSNGELFGSPTQVSDTPIDLTNIFRVSDGMRETQIASGMRFIFPKVTKEITQNPDWNGEVEEFKINNSWGSPALFDGKGHTIRCTLKSGTMPEEIGIYNNQLMGKFTKTFDGPRIVTITGTRDGNTFTPVH